MLLNAKEQVTIRRYLLGKAVPEEQALLEERLLRDSDFYEELLVAEDELVDQYVANQLPEAEIQSFKTNFLSTPERRQKLGFARSLRRYVNEGAKDRAEGVKSDPGGEVAQTGPKKRPAVWFLPTQNPILSYALGVAVLLLVVGAWIATNNWSTPQTGPGNVLTVVLTPGLTRESGQIKAVQIPSDTDTLQLQLALASDDYQSYRAELLTSERVTVVVKENLKPESSGDKSINLLVPTRVVKRDDYLLKLAGQRADGTYEDIGGYRFRVLN